MININRIELEVAKLDGFLYGTAAFSGKIRDYSAFSYLIKMGEFSSVESSLINHFNNQAKLVISNVKYLKGGLRDVEHEIGDYLIRDTSNVNHDNLTDLRKYLSFRVMDFISDILDDILDKDRNIDVLKMDSNSDSSESQCVFFCVRVRNLVLVLQFNNDIEFMKQQEQRYIQELQHIEEQNRAM